MKEVKRDYNDFQNYIKERGILYLIHFTPTLNLMSMLENGAIMSRAKIESLDIDAYDIMDFVQFTDEVRYDDKNYINLSISGPNTFLFQKFIQRTKDDPSINWCVLKIDPKHIYDSETLFSVTNAASYASKKSYGITGDLDKLKMLFSPSVDTGKHIFNRSRIADRFPTDVQAEVLVKNSIPSSSIMEVCFKNESALAQAKAAMSDYNTTIFKLDPEAFNPDRTK